MGHGPGRPVKTPGRPHGHGERRRSSSSSAPHLMGSGPGRPVKTHGPPHGPGGAAYIQPTSHGPWPFHGLGRGRARPIKISEHGSGPGPAHQNFRGWAAARPSPSHFQIFKAWPDAARRNFRTGPARPGPAHDKPCIKLHCNKINQTLLKIVLLSGKRNKISPKRMRYHG